MQQNEDKAVEAALEGRWDEAIRLNTLLLEQTPFDIDALNRLAFAQAQSTDFENACKTYRYILQIDPQNPIALKNLKKYRDIAECVQSAPSRTIENLNPDQFVSDTEKTKVVKLVNSAPLSVLRTVCIGEKVKMHKKGYDIQIVNLEGTYIGTLPDDIGKEFRKQLRSNDGSSTCYIKDVDDKSVLVFIKYYQ